jgi:hypothetical protein
VAAFAEDVTIRRFAEQNNNIVHWSDFDTGATPIPRRKPAYVSFTKPVDTMHVNGSTNVAKHQKHPRPGSRRH